MKRFKNEKIIWWKIKWVKQTRIYFKNKKSNKDIKRSTLMVVLGIKTRLHSLAPYSIEEAYELVDAIENNDIEEIKKELGDLLLQVILIHKWPMIKEILISMM